MKAYVLYSGGLDSILSIKLMQEQNIPVLAVHFITPFFNRSEFCQKVAKKEGFELIIKDLGKIYLKLLRNPKYGFGCGLNPCIDCHMLMIKEMKKMAKDGFIVTGEVVGQRPKSQKSDDLKLIENETELNRKILRPLCAKLLPPTKMEEEGIVDRDLLLGIGGRSRNIQFQLAGKYKVEFLTPAGGCMLTEKEYCAKLKDLLNHKLNPSTYELKLLKKGRHFRIGESKIIVGRNETENNELEKIKEKTDYIFQTEGIGPNTLLLGPKTKEAIKLAAELTLAYSDEENSPVLYGKNFEKKMIVEKITKEKFEKFKII